MLATDMPIERHRVLWPAILLECGQVTEVVLK